MTVLNFFKRVGTFFVKIVKTCVSKIMNANVEQVVKAGAFVGTSAVCGVAVVKAARDIRKETKENKTVTEELLDLNYADREKAKALHPLMANAMSSLDKKLGDDVSKNGRRLSKKNIHQIRDRIIDPRDHEIIDFEERRSLFTTKEDIRRIQEELRDHESKKDLLSYIKKYEQDLKDGKMEYEVDPSNLKYANYIDSEVLSGLWGLEF